MKRKFLFFIAILSSLLSIEQWKEHQWRPC